MSREWRYGSDTRWRRFRASILRLELAEPMRPRCAIGGPKCVGVATHVDHVIPLEQGGAKYDAANCRPACEPCNTGRRTRSAVGPGPAPRPVSKW